MTHFWRHVSNIPGILFQVKIYFSNLFYIYKKFVFDTSKAKGFHDHPRPSTKSSATSLKRKGHVKRSTTKVSLPSQSLEQCFKTEQTELRHATFPFDPASHPQGAYWWDQNEIHMMQPVNGKIQCYESFC